MTEQTTGAPAAEPSPADQKAALMASPEFRAGAMKAGSAQWQQLSALNEAIAAQMEAAEGGGQDEPQRPAALTDTDEEGNVHTFEVPATPEAYRLPSQDAKRLGLAVDFAAEAEMRAGFHKAGVDENLAQLLYSAAMNAALKPPTEVDMAGLATKTGDALRQAWGADFENNLQLAADEAQRLFDTLPASLTGGVDLETYARQAGLANNRVLIENLYLRGKARARKG